jgi:hypothetical protein
MSGTRELRQVGLLITTGIGHGSIHGDGRGWTMRAGDMRLSTTDDGSMSMAAGDGFPAPSRNARFMHRLSWLSWVEVLEAEPMLPGFHSDRVKCTYLHIV